MIKKKSDILFLNKEILRMEMIERLFPDNFYYQDDYYEKIYQKFEDVPKNMYVSIKKK
jgi:hypothetical protein